MRYGLITLALVAAQTLAAPPPPQGIQEWMKRSNGVYSLHEAAQAGDTGVLQARLSEGANVNGRNEQGATPLHLAAKAGNAEAVKLLLEAGADKTIQDNNGKTAADYATGACAGLLK